MQLDLDDSPEALAIFLAANPGQTARDFKGKGFGPFVPFDKHYIGMNEEPWHKLEPGQVRSVATSEKARFLTKAERQAAGRDPGLIWDEQARTYRRRAAVPPAPPPPSSGDVEGGGGSKSSRGLHADDRRGHELKCKPHF